MNKKMYIAKNRITEQCYGPLFEEKKDCNKFIKEKLEEENQNLKLIYSHTKIPVIVAYDIEQQIYVE